MEIKIEGWEAKWAVIGGVLILFAVFLDLLPGTLPVSLGCIAWGSMLGGACLILAVVFFQFSKDARKDIVNLGKDRKE